MAVVAVLIAVAAVASVVGERDGGEEGAPGHQGEVAGLHQYEMSAVRAVVEVVEQEPLREGQRGAEEEEERRADGGGGHGQFGDDRASAQERQPSRDDLTPGADEAEREERERFGQQAEAIMYSVPQPGES